MMDISLNTYSIYIDANNLLTIFIIFLLYKKKFIIMYDYLMPERKLFQQTISTCTCIINNPIVIILLFRNSVAI